MPVMHPSSFDHTDLRGESVLAWDEPSHSKLGGEVSVGRGMEEPIPIRFLESDYLCLDIGLHGDVNILGLALSERDKTHRELLLVFFDPELAGLGDLPPEVLIAVVVVCPMRVPLFLKRDEAQKAGLLCQEQLFLESADLFVNRILAGGLHRLSLRLLGFLKGSLLSRALLGFLFFVWEYDGVLDFLLEVFLKVGCQ